MEVVGSVSNDESSIGRQESCELDGGGVVVAAVLRAHGARLRRPEVRLAGVLLAVVLLALLRAEHQLALDDEALVHQRRLALLAPAALHHFFMRIKCSNEE